MDRIEAMKIFVSVAELKSFTQAAERRHQPKATVSMAVQELERLLGVKLLHRTTRRVTLSPEGQSYYERCLDLLADLDESESMFRSQATEIKGKIRVDMTVALARNLVIPALPDFFERHPQVELELSSTDRRVDLIREGIDCVIRAGKSNEPGLISHELGQMKMLNCASPAYLAQFGTPRSLEELSQHHLIFYSMFLGGKPEGFEYFDGTTYREKSMKGVLTVNNTVAYEAACLAGLGIVQCPLAGVKPHLDHGHLVEILPDFRAEPMPLKLVYPYRRRQAKRLRVFVEWLEPLIATYLAD
ncbi:MAG: LysR family transcriptional regulator [Candidatus Sericytochromatia bacterium]